MGLVIALAPVWHVVIALGVAALIWLVVIAWLWEAGQKVRAAIVRRNGAPQSNQQQ